MSIDLLGDSATHSSWEKNFTRGLLSMKDMGDVAYLQRLVNKSLDSDPVRINGIFNKGTQNKVRELLELATDKDSNYINKIINKMKNNLSLKSEDIMSELRKV